MCEWKELPIPSTLTSCPSESGTSPVPGGMSITRMSRPGPFGSAPRQSTSKSNCCTAFCTMRPRQVTGASAPGRRNPMDMAGRPWFVSGRRAPPDAEVKVIRNGGNVQATTNWMSDEVLRQFQDQGAWVLRVRRCQDQAHRRVRVGGLRGKRRDLLGKGCHNRSDLICGIDNRQTSDGALAYAALTASNGDDLLHVWNTSLGGETATWHYWGFTTLRKALREVN
jgi:hypothetical protein